MFKNPYMRNLPSKAARAGKRLFTNPRDFWISLKAYALPARSGTIQVNGVNFEIDLELDPLMRSMYFRSYEFLLTRTIERFLREGDIFIDVGANVGYISAFALGLVGRSGEVHAFEPVPRYLARLRKVRDDNPDYRLHVNGVALGEREGTARIAVAGDRNIGFNTMVPGFMRKDGVSEEVEVRVITLSDYLSAGNIRNVRLVKIDTEGFEFPVMRGFEPFLRQTDEPPVIITEIAPGAYSQLGTSCGEFARFMEDLGYVARSIDRLRPVDVGALDRTVDVVFLPQKIDREIAGSGRRP